MTILEDTRQKSDKHKIKHSCFDEMGVQIIRNMLPFGDYAFPPNISVDTKENMDEIAGNIGGAKQEHERFKRECISAKEAGTQLYILVETEWDIRSIDDVHKWVNPALIYRPRSITGDRLEKAMKTMSERYGVKFMFCAPCDSAEMIIRILSGEYENGEND